MLDLYYEWYKAVCGQPIPRNSNCMPSNSYIELYLILLVLKGPESRIDVYVSIPVIHLDIPTCILVCDQ